jgi:hypothetical protein
VGGWVGEWVGASPIERRPASAERGDWAALLFAGVGESQTGADGRGRQAATDGRAHSISLQGRQRSPHACIVSPRRPAALAPRQAWSTFSSLWVGRSPPGSRGAPSAAPRRRGRRSACPCSQSLSAILVSQVRYPSGFGDRRPGRAGCAYTQAPRCAHSGSKTTGPKHMQLWLQHGGPRPGHGA